MRVRPQGAAQPRQGVPDAPPLRRTGADAHPPRPGAAPRSAALLMRPTNEAEVRDAIAQAIRRGATLDIRGGGRKAALGAPRPEATVPALSAIAALVAYGPPELVLTVLPGPPLAEAEALLPESSAQRR